MSLYPRKVRGSEAVKSGASLDIESGGALKIAGTALTPSAAELNKLNAVTGYPVEVQEVLFTENGAGTYTGAVSVPAGATLLDIIVTAVALWTAATSAAMKVGDVANDDGFFVGVDLKATDLLADESISFSHPGGKQGADLDAIDVGGEGGLAASTNVHVRRRYLATARVISGIVTSVGAGTAGRTRLQVIYSLPTAAAAVKT